MQWKMKIPPQVSSVAMLCLCSVYVCYLLFALVSTLNASIDEKYTYQKLSINMVCDELDRLAHGEGNIAILTRVATQIDAGDGAICALYDSDFNILSRRTPLPDVTPFNPADYPELANMIRLNRQGEATVWYSKPGLPQHAVKVYFRWASDVFVILGVSRYTVNSPIYDTLYTGAVILAGISGVSFLITGLSLWTERRRMKHEQSVSTAG